MQLQEYVPTSSCMTQCFGQFSPQSYMFCTNSNTGASYCCEKSSNKTQCKNANCSNQAISYQMSYTYCQRGAYVDCGDLVLYAQTTSQSVLSNTLSYTDNKLCYWKVTTNRTENYISDTYKIVLTYAFASDIYLLTGSSIKEAENATMAYSGLTYTFPVLHLGAVNTIWIVSAPESQSLYDVAISFSYYIDNNVTAPTGKEATVTITFGLEVWQVVLIGVGAGLVGFIISCVVTRFVCKLGVPKHKPWEKNREFYPGDETEKGISKGKSVESSDTQRDHYDSNTKGENDHETPSEKKSFFSRLFSKKRPQAVTEDE